MKMEHESVIIEKMSDINKCNQLYIMLPEVTNKQTCINN